MTRERAAGRTLTVAAAADELGVSADLVMKWAKAGHFGTFLPPGVELGANVRGPKTVRVIREDWDRFIKAHTQHGVVERPAEDAKPARPAPAIPAGPDGVVRRKKRGGRS